MKGGPKKAADANGEVVTRDEIMDAIWPGMEVTDDVLTRSPNNSASLTCGNYAGHRIFAKK